VPDPIKSRFEVLDERFEFCHGDPWLEHLYTGCRWTEGPAYFPAGRYLVFSDIPNDRLLRWDETSGAVSVFRHPAGYANGHIADRRGRLVSCEHGRRAVTRTEADGSLTVLADAYDGKRLNSPNDVAEHPGRSPLPPATSTALTAWPSRPTSGSSTSPTAPGGTCGSPPWPAT
jgi:gluconolactonase